MSTLGHRQAREVGRYLDSVFSEEGIHAKDITLLSSPFLRCVQTSNELLSEFNKTPGDVANTVLIKPEYSIFELDCHNAGFHDSLPTMAERKCYFPRLDENYQTNFIPALPESKDEFVDRCAKAIAEVNKQYTFRPNSAIVLVTHAAGCVAMAAAAAGLTLQDINAASPCGIYRLTRTIDSGDKWEIDFYGKKGGMNGFTGHLSDMGEHTIPWNHFGPKDVNNGYTGPPMD